jgi:hypothetical protein
LTDGFCSGNLKSYEAGGGYDHGLVPLRHSEYFRVPNGEVTGADKAASDKDVSLCSTTLTVVDKKGMRVDGRQDITGWFAGSCQHSVVYKMIGE